MVRARCSASRICCFGHLAAGEFVDPVADGVGDQDDGGGQKDQGPDDRSGGGENARLAVPVRVFGLVILRFVVGGLVGIFVGFFCHGRAAAVAVEKLPAEAALDRLVADHLRTEGTLFGFFLFVGHGIDALRFGFYPLYRRIRSPGIRIFSGGIDY